MRWTLKTYSSVPSKGVPVTKHRNRTQLLENFMTDLANGPPFIGSSTCDGIEPLREQETW